MTGKRERDRAERNERAAQMHLMGMSIAQIAEQIGLRSKSATHAAVQAGLAALGGLAPTESGGSPVTDAAHTGLAELGGLMPRFYREAMKGDEKAADRVLKIIEQRMKLIQLISQPAAAAAGGTDEEGVASVTDIAARRARRLAAGEGSPPP